MTVHNPIRLPCTADGLLIDVARRIQLRPTKNAEVDRRYHALCAHVDRVGSPLEGLVLACYPGGSFATGTVVASKVSKDQHDLDVIVEINADPKTSPQLMLSRLYQAINGEDGSRYNGKVRLNSRCVTVHYEDGTTVDLMPIARLAGQPLKAGNLFHWKNAEQYHKPVNPWGFANHFNNRVAIDPAFAELFDERRRLAEGLALAKAEADPLPQQIPLPEKSPRVVALQLLKRFRDLRYRSRPGRKPPSIVLAALALGLPANGEGLTRELLQIVDYVAAELAALLSVGRLLEVRNPAYNPDLFTDRWPRDVAAQEVFLRDLRHLRTQLIFLDQEGITLTQMKSILQDLFGETAAKTAVDNFLEGSRRDAGTGRIRFGPRGRVLTGAAAAAAASTSTGARASTSMGGECIPG
jgi:hypothetical protein